MWGSLISMALLLSPSAAKAQPEDLLIGTFTNEEQVYFDNEAKRLAPDRLSLRIARNGDTLTIEKIDAFGMAQSRSRTATIQREGDAIILDHGKCQQRYRLSGDGLIANGSRGTCDFSETINGVTASAMTVAISGGQTTELRRSRPVSCWVAILKEKPKSDGTDDWYFKRDVVLHDQGGRARVGGGDSGAPELIIRIRNVTWDKGSSNKPAITLYVHKPEKPERAEAYSWAAPDSSRLGINLRWMQTGCALGV